MPAFSKPQGVEGMLSYTDKGGTLPSGAMSLSWSRNISPRTVLWIIEAGFALVLLLLGTACFIAIKGTKAIQADAETLLREELTIARLLNEVQVEESTLSAVLHRLTDRKSPIDRTFLRRELAEADHALSRVSRWAQQSPEAARWRELEATVAQFTASAREVIAKEDRSDVILDKLFLLHDSVVALVQDLVTASTQRAVNVDQVLASRSRELADESFSLLGACFFLALACSALTVYTSRRTLRRVEWQAGELGRVSWHMLQTQEAAARRFSHELHDELGQSLAAIRANLAASTPHDSESRRADCLEVVDAAIANVRELSQLLRPVILDDFGLDAALRWLTEKFSQRTNICVHYESNLPFRLAEQSETHLFRIAQEALTNIARHAGASNVRVVLDLKDDTVSLLIEDDGRGLQGHSNPERSSLGMTGMRARARQMGGELAIASSRSGGVKVQADIPASEPANVLG